MLAIIRFKKGQIWNKNERKNRNTNNSNEIKIQPIKYINKKWKWNNKYATIQMQQYKCNIIITITQTHSQQSKHKRKLPDSRLPLRYNTVRAVRLPILSGMQPENHIHTNIVKHNEIIIVLISIISL